MSSRIVITRLRCLQPAVELGPGPAPEDAHSLPRFLAKPVLVIEMVQSEGSSSAGPAGGQRPSGYDMKAPPGLRNPRSSGPQGLPLCSQMASASGGPGRRSAVALHHLIDQYASSKTGTRRRFSTSRFWLTQRRKDRKGRQILWAFLASLREIRELLRFSASTEWVDISDMQLMGHNQNWGKISGILTMREFSFDLRSMIV